MRVVKLLCLIGIFAGQIAIADTNKNQPGSNLKPLSFGTDQTIVDLKTVVWNPLKVDGLASGAEIAVLRGNLENGSSESFLRLPAGYDVPLHSHTSDELYIWIAGSFLLIAPDKTPTQFDAPAYINFPGNAPPTALNAFPKNHTPYT